MGITDHASPSIVIPDSRFGEKWAAALIFRCLQLDLSAILHHGREHPCSWNPHLERWVPALKVDCNQVESDPSSSSLIVCGFLAFVPSDKFFRPGFWLSDWEGRFSAWSRDVVSWCGSFLRFDAGWRLLHVDFGLIDSPGSVCPSFCSPLILEDFALTLLALCGSYDFRHLGLCLIRAVPWVIWVGLRRLRAAIPRIHVPFLLLQRWTRRLSGRSTSLRF